jgi:hypothetical protein
VDNPALAPGIPGTGGPRIGDYTGLPLNDAARHKADSWDASLMTVREHQAQPATAAFFGQVPSDLRISTIVDADSQRLVAIETFQPLSRAKRTIWMDGRPRPPSYAAHTWSGFSIGRWDGDALVVETTHLKAGFLERNGVPHSDGATLVEHFVRHGDVLTLVSVVTDPAYLEEPLVRSVSWMLNRNVAPESGPARDAIDEFPGIRPGQVPHHLPGTNQFLIESATRLGLPAEAMRGGRQTAYPEFQIRLKELDVADTLARAPVSVYVAERDASRNDLQTSVEHVRRLLSSNPGVHVVNRRELADIIVTIVDRGVGPDRFAGRTTKGGQYAGAELTTTPVTDTTRWVSALVEIGDRKKELLGVADASPGDRRRGDTGREWRTAESRLVDDLIELTH